MGALTRRLAFAPVVVLAVTALIYGMLRLLRPDMYPGQALAAGTLHDLDRIVLHFDFGCAADWPGCPPITTLWGRAWIWDVWLLGGAMLIGLGGGWLAGIWCAARPRRVSARVLEGVAMVLYCTPVYVVGMVILKLFNSTYGIVPLPAFFDADPEWATPWGDPWAWFRSLLVPWLVLAAPLGAMVLRLTLGHTLEAMGEDFVRTGVGKGLTHRRVVGRHAGPFSLVSTLPFVTSAVPLLVTNMVLVEMAFSVRGFFFYTWRASGHESERDLWPDYPMMQALAVWATVLIVVLSLLAELLLPRLDPRTRR